MTSPDYLFDPQFNLSPNYSNALAMDILSIGFTDDTLAPADNIAHFLNFFENARVFSNIIDLGKVDALKIGHTGFYKEKFKTTLWQAMVKWLESGKFSL